MTNLFVLAPHGSEAAQFSMQWRYQVEPSKHGRHKTVRTTCIIKKNGEPLLETDVVKSVSDKHEKELARKYSLRKTLLHLPKITRTAIWKAYLGRFETVSIEPQTV